MSAENRRFLRVPMSRAGEAALLRFDGKSLQCEIANESSGGYGVIAPSADASVFLPGRILILEMSDLVVKVRVAHAAFEDDLLKVGLERIGDVEEETAQNTEWTWLNALKSSIVRPADGDSTFVRDLAVAALLAGGLLIAMILPTAMGQTQGKKTGQSAIDNTTARSTNAKRSSGIKRESSARSVAK